MKSYKFWFPKFEKHECSSCSSNWLKMVKDDKAYIKGLLQMVDRNSLQKFISIIDE